MRIDYKLRKNGAALGGKDFMRITFCIYIYITLLHGDNNAGDKVQYSLGSCLAKDMMAQDKENQPPSLGLYERRVILAMKYNVNIPRAVEAAFL